MMLTNEELLSTTISQFQQTPLRKKKKKKNQAKILSLDK